MSKRTAIRSFVDESIFSGTKEFATPIGKMRVMRDGALTAYYTQIDGGFVRRGAVKLAYESSPRRHYNRLCKLIDAAEVV